jgi:hypothetical protein
MSERALMDEFTVMAMNTYGQQSRPVSIIITQVLMLINLAPVTLGLVWAFFQALITNPASLTSFRASVFFGIGFGLMFIFLVYGFGGLWKRKKSGYWLGLLFLAVGFAAGLYKLVTPFFVGSNETTSLLHGNRSPGLIAFGLVLQSLILLLVSGLFLKLLFGKNEKSFFNTPVKD